MLAGRQPEERGAGAKGRLAIIAGNGRLPHDVAAAARAHGEDPFVVVLRGERDGDWSGFEHMVIGTGDFAALKSAFAARGVERVVLSGGVRQRPEWRDLKPTLSHILRLPAIIRTLLSGGDDRVLRMVIDLIESLGYRVVGAHEIVPGLLAAEGPLTLASPSADDAIDIEMACKAARALGRLDVGQGAVSVGGRIVALEGVEGTDAMLARVAELRAEGRISARRKGVLVKLCKPQQDLRADLPSIGVSTVRCAAKAGLAGIAVEAGRSLVLDRAEMVAEANRLGLFVTGLGPGTGLSS